MGEGALGGHHVGAGREGRIPVGVVGVVVGVDHRLDGAAAEPLEGDPEELPEAGETSAQGELNIDAAAPKPAPEPRKPAGPPPDKIVSLFLLARDNHVITGADLLQATVSTGMEFGDMNIFHRVPEGDERSVFSMANAAKPGHFERDEWNTFETTGVVVFANAKARELLEEPDEALVGGRAPAVEVEPSNSIRAGA